MIHDDKHQRKMVDFIFGNMISGMPLVKVELLISTWDYLNSKKLLEATRNFRLYLLSVYYEQKSTKNLIYENLSEYFNIITGHKNNVTNDQ